ncbi:MAG: hypothetical protein ACRBM6_37850 [Geminicoccales bacterium]
MAIDGSDKETAARRCGHGEGGSVEVGDVGTALTDHHDLAALKSEFEGADRGVSAWPFAEGLDLDDFGLLGDAANAATVPPGGDDASDGSGLSVNDTLLQRRFGAALDVEIRMAGIDAAAVHGDCDDTISRLTGMPLEILG